MKVKDAMFTDTPAEAVADMLSCDPAYEDWSDSLDSENGYNEFGEDANDTGDLPPF